MNNIDLRVAEVLASELANENLQLRQAVIRLRIELDEALKPGEAS